MLNNYGQHSEFEAAIRKLAARSKSAVQKQKDESKTIHSIILPFINALGYDTYNDEEVVPEYSADVGIKHGEKVDYALIIDGKPIILIEVKAATMSLSTTHQSQLFRYFTTTDVRIAILTNGVEAWFYSDLNKPNVMDDEPFFKLNFQEIKDTDINFLKLLCKNNFSIYDIIGHAQTLKNADKIKDYIKSDIINPSDDFIQLVGKAITGNRLRKHEVESFQASIKSAFSELMQSSRTIEQPTTATPHVTAVRDSIGTNFTASSVKKDKPLSPDAIRVAEYFNTEPVRSLFQRYSRSIKEIAGEACEKKTVLYYTYRKGRTPFASIGTKSNSFIRIDLKLNHFSDLHGLTEGIESWIKHDGTITGHWGIGNYYVDVYPNSNHDYIIQQIKRAYDIA